MNGAAHVALIGLSGTGKSTVAPMVAAGTGRIAIDLDAMIEAEAGLEVSEVFAREGEAGFRRREVAALVEALSGPPAVLATGGGVVVTPEAAAMLADSCTVVWMRAQPKELVDRLRESPEPRPLLAGDAEAALVRLAAERDPLYRSAADMTIDVDTVSASEVAGLVVELLGQNRS